MKVSFSNITLHLLFLSLRPILSEIHLLLAPNREHGEDFEKFPITGFR